MNKNACAKYGKLFLDLILLVLLALMYQKKVISMGFHEIGGLALLGLFLLHKALNWQWSRAVTAGIFHRRILHPYSALVRNRDGRAGSSGSQKHGKTAAHVNLSGSYGTFLCNQHFFTRGPSMQASWGLSFFMRQSLEAPSWNTG